MGSSQVKIFVPPAKRKRRPAVKHTPWKLRPETDVSLDGQTGRVVVLIRNPKLRTSSTNGSHGHWRANVAKVKGQRRLAKQLLDHIKAPSLPVVVKMVRHSAGVLDGHENMPQSCKHMVDEVADWLGIADNDPRVTWEYEQVKCARGEHAVEIRWRTR